MKKRFGFVSNSSSTSFCLFCAYITDQDEINKIFDRDIPKKLQVEYPIEGEEEGIYVGLYPEDIKDDETGLEFKTRVQKSISDILGREVKCDWVTDGGYNG